MNITEAQANIGKPFKVKDMPGLRSDIIRLVGRTGEIEGDFIIANCEDCRFILPQPEHLKKLQQ